MEKATRSSRVAWVVPNGVVPQDASCRPPREVLSPRKTPAWSGQGATDAKKRPSKRAARWIRRRCSEHRSKASTGEIDAVTLTKLTNCTVDCDLQLAVSKTDRTV